MSVYKQGDRRDDDKEPPKKNEFQEGLDKIGKDITKGFSNLFGGKDKKWEKKGGGHTLGTAADAEAARQARCTALDQSGTASASSTPRQPVPARQPSGAASAAVAAAEARAAGGGRTPRATAAPAVARGASHSAAAESQLSAFPNSSASGQSFPGPGYTTSPATQYASEIGMLQGMGFSAEAATRALVKTGGDIEQAVVVLTADPGGATAPGAVDGAAVSGEAAAAERMAMLAEASLASAEHAPALGMALAGMRGGGACLGLVRKLVANVKDHADEPKYRKVRLTNPKVAEALGGLLEGYALLSACGFAFDDTGEFAEMADAAVAAGGGLSHVCAALDEAIACAAAGGPPVPVGPFDVKVLVAPEGGGPIRFDDVGDDFYQITPAEAKALMDLAAAKRKEDEVFKTKETRELEAARRKRIYRKGMIRVRFPDGVVLQATFSSSATVGDVLAWVEGSMREPGHAFELSIARGQPLRELGETLEAAQLCPAALLNFRSPPEEMVQPPYVKSELMTQSQVLGLEDIPQGLSAEEARVWQEARDSGRRANPSAYAHTEHGGEGRRPRWMK